MENMTQKDNLLKMVENKINSIKTKLESYKKVDATLSEQTLFETAAYLEMADNKLEKGFVKDACDEIDKALLAN